ncbi:metallophosphoesterase family protein [Acetobacter fallax]|uniref:Metallophosphoesterase n=1 Tax=Acetobacter fallax TaxID=1737473 RepID=A0ABX0KAX7_9PROT|nr:metallophosphoesterase [Acetobacter fallax]NHO32907.1 metallophosphoesterase [Acetobacter fallax]NHO36469.1 metallophosphoesterase [Acetobacter fallax]
MSAVLAHLSDLHIPTPAAPALRSLASKRALSLLSWHLRRRHIHTLSALTAVLRDIEASRPDALAITGDLTNLGTPREFRAARLWLSQLSLPVAVIPGNHDALTPIPWADGPGLWAPYGGMTAPDEPLVTRIHDVALIGLSSAVPTAPFFASGMMGETQAEKLADILTRTGAEGLCRVVMIHHPPRHDLVVWRKALRDIDRFTQVVRNAGAELILHGHSHRGTFSTLPESDIPVIGVTSASHRPGRSGTAAGWNHIAIERSTPENWTIAIRARRLDTQGTLHDYMTRNYTRPARTAPDVTPARTAHGAPLA